MSLEFVDFRFGVLDCLEFGLVDSASYMYGQCSPSKTNLHTTKASQCPDVEIRRSAERWLFTRKMHGGGAWEGGYRTCICTCPWRCRYIFIYMKMYKPTCRLIPNPLLALTRLRVSDSIATTFGALLLMIKILGDL